MYVANLLRQNPGVYHYYFGVDPATDPEFIKRVDAEWVRFYFLFDRKMWEPRTLL